MKDWTEEDWEHFEDALRRPEPWDVADQLLAPPPDPAPLRELAARLDGQRAAARTLLGPLLASSAAFDAEKVEHDAEFQTSAVVEILTEAATGLRERQPQFALATATAAVTIATKLARVDELRNPSLLGDARRERGKVLATIGRYREAEEELRRADDAYAGNPHATAWQLARVSLIRANVWVETHRFDDAIREADDAARVLAAFGDTRRYLAARLVKGGVLLLQREFRAAADLLDALAEEARRAGDREHLARARQTAGNCYIELGEHQKAAGYFLEAMALWDDLGLEIERVRTNWSMGFLLRAMGDLDGAIERIDEARRAFEALGIVNDAAITRLELAEVLLLADRPAEVPDLLRDVVVSFTSEGIMQNAKIALAYLREAVDAGAIEVRVIRHVREYLEELPSHPTEIFMPLR